MPTLLFSRRFAPAVEAGTKRQTIRPPRKRPIRAGDQLSLREWTGAPYRSKQRTLGFGVCMSVEPVEIGLDFADDEESRRDGFADAADMRQWFEATHGLPFHGLRISWA